MTLTRAVLERAGSKNNQIIELPIAQHVAAIAAGQVDAVYTLEPTGTVGRLNGTTRNLEVGVIAKYVLGDPMALGTVLSEPDLRVYSKEYGGHTSLYRRLPKGC